MARSQFGGRRSRSCGRTGRRRRRRGRALHPVEAVHQVDSPPARAMSWWVAAAIKNMPRPACSSEMATAPAAVAAAGQRAARAGHGPRSRQPRGPRRAAARRGPRTAGTGWRRRLGAPGPRPQPGHLSHSGPGRWPGGPVGPPRRPRSRSGPGGQQAKPAAHRGTTGEAGQCRAPGACVRLGGAERVRWACRSLSAGTRARA